MLNNRLYNWDLRRLFS